MRLKAEPAGREVQCRTDRARGSLRGHSLNPNPQRRHVRREEILHEQNLPCTPAAREEQPFRQAGVTGVFVRGTYPPHGYCAAVTKIPSFIIEGRNDRGTTLIHSRQCRLPLSAITGAAERYCDRSLSGRPFPVPLPAPLSAEDGAFCVRESCPGTSFRAQRVL